uniref:Uncharacterized protein n=1 Tax=Anguilla anguilla TaxID=7936 RepID=A0A0E9RPX1_ANGAN
MIPCLRGPNFPLFQIPVQKQGNRKGFCGIASRSPAFSLRWCKSGF